MANTWHVRFVRCGGAGVSLEASRIVVPLAPSRTADPPPARTAADGYDAVNDEVERWERLSMDAYSEFFDESDGLLNEFEMMWALRERFPLHGIVFKQTACHLAHEANVEQVFSRAGRLSDPNMNPHYLGMLVMVGMNKKNFKPSLKEVKELYYNKFRHRGTKLREHDPCASGCTPFNT